MEKYIRRKGEKRRTAITSPLNWRVSFQRAECIQAGNDVVERERERKKKEEEDEKNRKNGESSRGGGKEKRKKREKQVHGTRICRGKFRACQLFNRSCCSLARYNVKILFRTSRFVETSVACRDSENNFAPSRRIVTHVLLLFRKHLARRGPVASRNERRS